jgi:hypothetical protein
MEQADGHAGLKFATRECRCLEYLWVSRFHFGCDSPLSSPCSLVSAVSAGGNAAVAILGGMWLIATYYVWAGAQDGPSGRKVCPECAEAVQAAARVCKHCGFRWELTADGA